MRNTLLLGGALALVFLAIAYFAFPSKAKAATPGSGTSYSDCIGNRNLDHMVCIMEWAKTEAEAVAMAKNHLEACTNVTAAYAAGKYDAAAVRHTLRDCYRMTEYMNLRWKDGFPR